MLPKHTSQANVDRFTGFENLYDQHRPEAPHQVLDILQSYVNKRPELVVDIGCGTGLSTFIWKHAADRIIGIEPNPDMLRKAKEKLSSDTDNGHIVFLRGYSNATSLEDDVADVMTCSQSFHWMDPDTTLQEINRVLKIGGVFAAYDCDWPPHAHWTVEQAYDQLIQQADELLQRLEKPEGQVLKRDKENHLSNMKESGFFRFTTEIVFHHMEACDAERYVGLALSQGSVQSVLKLGNTELQDPIERFRETAAAYFQGNRRDVLFSYRMRLGMK